MLNAFWAAIKAFVAVNLFIVLLPVCTQNTDFLMDCHPLVAVPCHVLVFSVWVIAGVGAILWTARCFGEVCDAQCE